MQCVGFLEVFLASVNSLHFTLNLYFKIVLLILMVKVQLNQSTYISYLVVNFRCCGKSELINIFYLGVSQASFSDDEVMIDTSNFMPYIAKMFFVFFLSEVLILSQVFHSESFHIRLHTHRSLCTLIQFPSC